MPVGQSDNEEIILKVLKGAQGPELLKRIANILATQERKIEELTTSLQLLKIYEKHGGALFAATETAALNGQNGAAPKYASTYVVSAADYLLEADGFHSVEHSSAGRAFRWSAITGFLKFSFYVDRSVPLDLQFVFFSAVDPENFEQIRLTEGDREIPIAKAKSDGAVTFTAVLLPTPVPVETNLTITVPQVRQLGPEDYRVAGVAFHKLSVAPRVSEE